MSGLKKHGLHGHYHWRCRCDVCVAAYKRRAAAYAASLKADRKARPEFYRERDRVRRERYKESKRVREAEKRRRLSEERRAQKEAARPSKEAAAKERRRAKRHERYATLTRGNPEAMAARRAYNALWRAKNKELLPIKRREYRLNNKEKIAAYHKDRRRADPSFCIMEGLRRRLRWALTPAQKKSVKTTDNKLTGCTRVELRAHLESQFSPGMTWDNYGAWHVDHIRPCASFDLTVGAERQRCFHYLNLQPLWAEINMAKRDNVDFDVPYAMSQIPYPS